MQKLQVAEDAVDKVSLQQALSQLVPNLNDIEIRDGNKSPVQDPSQTLSSLGVKHGSLWTLVDTKPKIASTTKPSFVVASSNNKDQWHPFPDLAKDYVSAVRQARRRKGGLSYRDLAKMQSELHDVEAQPTGLLTRIYMCHVCADRFRNACITKDKTAVENQAGLLLGTLSRERLDVNRKRAKTSLSSTTEGDDYCQVAKVQAIWWDNTKRKDGDEYDADGILQLRDNKESDVLRVADWLGLRPVGWIFTYNDDRLKVKDTLPVFSRDMQVGAGLQIHEMKLNNRSEDSRSFCTLAMDGKTGATEAFQLSDVCVQMVAEGLFDEPKGRFVKTIRPVFVDGQETTEIDSVLCLVNTALLRHEGSFSGGTTTSVKKNGTLMTKTKKALLSALETSDDALLFETLSDFSLLLALDQWLGPQDSEILCRTVHKWVRRGQKRGTILDQRLKDRIKGILEAH
jgi:hypothetical protein